MKTKEINIGLVWANPYTGNLGVTALAFSTLFLLETLSESKKIKFNYFIVTSKGPKTDEFQIGKYLVTVRNIGWNYNGSLKSLVKLLVINPHQILNLTRLDIALDIGAGDSFSDIYGIKRFREINGIKRILQRLGKKTVFLPQTYGPYTSPEAQRGAIKSIRNAQLVLARDLQSYHYVRELIPDQEITESIDVAFFLPYEKISLATNTKQRIGINVSGLLWNGGYTKNNQFKLKSAYQDLMKDIIGYFSGNRDLEVYLVAHVILEDYENIENDYKVCVELSKTYPDTLLAPSFKSPVEAKSFIGSLDFFTGARMHSCIAAFSSGVPVFPLAYSRKFNGLFKETLKYNFYGDLVVSDKSEILDNLRSAFDNRESLKENINASHAVISQRRIDLLNHLSNAL